MVASCAGTDGSPWDDRNRSETRLVVLQEQGDQLVAVGEVDGIGDHMVLGIGQDATEDGRQTGLELSLFDVSDPTGPRVASVWTLPDSSSPAEWDHRAFQIFGSTAIVPVQNWNAQFNNDRFNGVVVFEIGATITEIGRFSHIEDDEGPASDCRPVDPADVPDSSELHWLASEPSIVVQVCGDADQGWFCDTIAGDDIRYWLGDETSIDAVLVQVGATVDDRFEICYPDSYYQDQIQRSLVANGVLWTMSPSNLQANDLESLAPLVKLGLR